MPSAVGHVNPASRTCSSQVSELVRPSYPNFFAASLRARSARVSMLVRRGSPTPPKPLTAGLHLASYSPLPASTTSHQHLPVPTVRQRHQQVTYSRHDSTVPQVMLCMTGYGLHRHAARHCAGTHHQHDPKLPNFQTSKLPNFQTSKLPNHKPQTTNHKPQTTNHKPKTTNQKPQTKNHKPLKNYSRLVPSPAGFRRGKTSFSNR